ncbi:hypothetical protein PJN36_29390, partial [Mycobacterium kansasii]
GCWPLRTWKTERMRGWPFHNAAVGRPENCPKCTASSARTKKRLSLDWRTRATNSVSDPDELGHQLAVLFEGAVALATTLNNTSPMVYARSAAAI